MQPIKEIAIKMGLDPDILIPQGHFKAKIPLSAINKAAAEVS